MAESRAEAEVVRFATVVVNWNRPEDTIACLESLRLASAGRVIVVDNGSSDGSVARIVDWTKSRKIATTVRKSDDDRDPYEPTWLTIIRSETNRGFSGGNNLGVEFVMQNTDATYWLLLNNDATVAPDFFIRISEAIRVQPDAGLLTGTIYHDPERERVWYAGGKDVPFRALVEHLHEIPKDGTPKATEFITGCAMVVSAKVWTRIGALPECYFPGYSEDAEYSRRAREAGFALIYAPAAIAYHKVGATAGPANESPFVLRAQMRHRVYYVRRNFRGLERFVALFYLAITKPVRAVIEMLKGRPRAGWAILSGTLEGFKNQV